MSIQYRGPQRVFVAADLTANQTSITYNAVGAMLQASVVFKATGSPNGTLYVDVTNDPTANEPALASTAAWVPLAFNGSNTAGIAIVASGNYNASWLNAYAYFRLRWVNTSSSASTGTGWGYGVSG